MTAHTPGSHTREIDLAVIRAWVKAGRPGNGPRDWYHRTWPERRHRRVPDRWAWWPALIVLAVAMTGMFVLSLVYPLEQRVARWCGTCHSSVTVDVQPELNWSR